MLFRPLIAQWIHQTLKPNIAIDVLEQSIIIPTESGLADAALPCFRFSKEMRLSPDKIAQTWAESLQKAPTPPWLKTLKSDKAYINFNFNHAWYTRHTLQSIHANSDYGNEWALKNYQGKSIAIDFSSPNMAKPIGIHHIRSTVIGNALANLFEFSKASVHRVNHIGDYGTNFGQLCYAFTQWGSKEELTARGIRHLLDIYVRFNQELEKKPELQERGKEWFARLEKKEPEAQKLWQLFRDVSEKEFQKIYTRMGVHFTSYLGEAHYADSVETTLAHIGKFVKLEESDGALVAFLEGFKTPMLLKKSDGTTLYSTRDLAAAYDRLHRYKATHLLYVVAIQQKLHFQQLFALLRKTDFNPQTSLEHISFGMLSFKDGTMSTRKGKIIFLEEVLEQASQKALEIINEKNPECPNKNDVAEAVGIGAVVFHDLKSKRERDVEFSWEEALNFEGDSGPYIQYTHARTHALFEKNGQPKWSALSEKTAFGDEAFRLAWTLSLFPYFVQRALDDREPCHVSQYLLMVCTAFNGFYAKIKIRELQDADREAHLQLVACAQRVLKRGLMLLGLKTPERI